MCARDGPCCGWPGWCAPPCKLHAIAEHIPRQGPVSMKDTSSKGNKQPSHFHCTTYVPKSDGRTRAGTANVLEIAWVRDVGHRAHRCRGGTWRRRTRTAARSASRWPQTHTARRYCTQQPYNVNAIQSKHDGTKHGNCQHSDAQLPGTLNTPTRLSGSSHQLPLRRLHKQYAKNTSDQYIQTLNAQVEPAE